MPKRPDSLETLQIALELIQRIPKGRTVTAAELRQQLSDAGFERDMRTIQRQLETLSEYLDLDRDDSTKPYRYSWKERAKGFSIPSLSVQESLLLTLAEQQLQNLLPARLMKSMEGFFVQARQQLGAQDSTKHEREWLEKVRVVSTGQPLLPPKVDPDVFEQVSNALFANQWLTVEYKNAAGKQTESRVMPLGLAQQGPRMYLVCRFDGYDNERSLALHRIVSARTSTFTFVRPKDFDLGQYDNDGRFAYGDGELVRLSFRIEKEAGLHLLESPLSAEQEVVELEDDYEISATVVDSAMLEWWLRGFGEAVRDIKKSMAVNAGGKMA
ncbi:WYL domain-containing protein [Dechloromonas denitrificans]|uniref:helix-turn-helix transcriptional regulator n=1 Tax=Dechloromonas denitrificans TaxID=281362 RepID=UPI001CF8527A|nr:WYL domain-containing protein [Dechloromonas denitrificans]UCV10281.1 WYL domain-containing protein [Dechloromonas denitrificans]